MRHGRPRVAIAHDYLTQRGGAERVVLAMSRAFPEAPIYTTFFEPAATFPEFADLDVRSSPLNRVAALRADHRRALLALPLASSAINIDADVVLASSSGWSHGFRTSRKKLVYCYSPARWLYQTDAYLGGTTSQFRTRALQATSPFLRAWDRRAASSADRYLAISSAVKDRVLAAYGIESEVLPAPHSLHPDLPRETVPGVVGDFYLCVSRLLPYKNVDKIIDAIGTSPSRQLVVVGAGPEEARLARTLPRNVMMLKHLSDAQMRWLYSRCRAVVAASYEDFGLTPIEAAVFGKPSAVLRWGGFLDTVSENQSGVFFDEPTAVDVSEALDRLESMSWDADAISAVAERFSEARFAEALRKAVDEMACEG